MRNPETHHISQYEDVTTALAYGVRHTALMLAYSVDIANRSNN